MVKKKTDTNKMVDEHGIILSSRILCLMIMRKPHICSVRVQNLWDRLQLNVLMLVITDTVNEAEDIANYIISVNMMYSYSHPF